MIITAILGVFGVSILLVAVISAACMVAGVIHLAGLIVVALLAYRVRRRATRALVVRLAAARAITVPPGGAR